MERHPERTARAGLTPFGDARRARVLWRDRLLAWLFSMSVHLIIFAALFSWHAATPSSHVRPPFSPIVVSLVDLPAAQPKATEVEARGRDNPSRPTRPHAVARTSPVPAVTSNPDTDNSDLLNEAHLAGATSVDGEGTGGNGRGCEMAAAVQQALRRDPLVRKAVEEANRLGKAMMLWNGDWVRSGAQDGKGLSGVREAVMWEVAFAPEACRNQRMHGPVLLSLADGDTRFAIGSNDWRWSDLLGVDRIAQDR